MDSAVEKTIEFRDSMNERRGEGCLIHALELFDANNGGEIIWVGNLKEYGYDFGVNHAYYIPPDAEDDSIALNQEDSGYDQYPPFTKRELEGIGKPEDISKLRESVVRSTDGYIL